MRLLFGKKSWIFIINRANAGQGHHLSNFGNADFLLSWGAESMCPFPTLKRLSTAVLLVDLIYKGKNSWAIWFAIVLSTAE